MAAEHAHSHAVADARNRTRLTLTLVLAAGYMVAEAIGGWWTGSLALLADAGHMLSDVAALSFGLFALWLAQRPPTLTRTYGFYRAEILAALVQGALLVAVAVFVWVEALERFGEPREILGGPMMAIAAGGLVVNLLGLWILEAGRHGNLNVRGAWLHVLSDALGSVGAITAGGAVWAFGWTWADPVASLVIGALVVHSAWQLLREAVSVLMESAPGHIDVDALADAIAAAPGVAAVHDLHVWTIRSGLVALSCHVVVPDGRDRQRALSDLHRILEDRFGIAHVTIQVEPERFEECRLDAHGAV